MPSRAGWKFGTVACRAAYSWTSCNVTGCLTALGTRLHCSPAKLTQQVRILSATLPIVSCHALIPSLRFLHPLTGASLCCRGREEGAVGENPRSAAWIWRRLLDGLLTCSRGRFSAGHYPTAGRLSTRYYPPFNASAVHSAPSISSLDRLLTQICR